MKIAMISSDYLPSIGGIASHIHELSKALIEQGHEVEVWYWDRKKEDNDKSSMGEIPVRLLNGGEGNSGSLKIAKKLTHSLKACLKEFPADILHIHTMDPLLLSTRALRRHYKGKIVWTNHSSRFLKKASESFLWRMKIKFYTRAIDGLLTASADRLEKSRFLNIKQILNVPNGVNIKNFSGISRNDARRLLNIENDFFVILYTGRFAPIKGVTYLAQALLELKAKTDNFLCIMCGNIEGDRESQKVKDILKTGSASQLVRFEGFIPNTELNKYLAACNVLVLPSLMEATSISGLEAMSSSRAIVGTRIGGITELLSEEENGYLVNAKDASDLAMGLLKAKHCNRLDEMGKNGYQRVLDHFTWEKSAEKISAFYSALLADTSR